MNSNANPHFKRSSLPHKQHDSQQPKNKQRSLKGQEIEMPVTWHLNPEPPSEH